jgi:Mismatch repair ATPase (MutS family)
MEFDMDALAPTYKIKVGLPGKSNAFEISRKLGLDSSIIDRAISLMNGSDLEFEGAVSRVEEDKKEVDLALEEARIKAAEAEKKLKEADEKLAKAKESKHKIIESAKEEAREIISDANRTVNEVSKELRKAVKEGINNSSAVVADSKRKLREKSIENAMTPRRVKNTNIPRAEDLKPGTRIKLLKLGQNGEVETSPDSSGKLTVRIGALKMGAKIKDVMIIEDNKPGTKERKRRGYAKMNTDKAKLISPCINVIGKNLDDAELEVSKYIDDAFLSGINEVQIVHGRGEGILRGGIRSMLKRNKNIKSIAGASYDQGGEGVTVVTFIDK